MESQQIIELYEYKEKLRKSRIEDLKQSLDRLVEDNYSIELYTLKSQVDEIDKLTIELILLNTMQNYNKL